MKLHYKIGETRYHLTATWSEAGRSTVFRSIQRVLSDRHWPENLEYEALAMWLDQQTDRIYEILRKLDNETLTSYDPTLSRNLRAIADEITRATETLARSEEGGVIFSLFSSVTSKLWQTIEVYLTDNRQKNKERMRIKRNKPFQNDLSLQELEAVIKEGSASTDDIVDRMVDMAARMQCLSEVQRRRLILNIFHGYTTREIARMENTTQPAVVKSIHAAMDILRGNHSKSK